MERPDIVQTSLPRFFPVQFFLKSIVCIGVSTSYPIPPYILFFATPPTPLKIGFLSETP